MIGIVKFNNRHYLTDEIAPQIYNKEREMQANILKSAENVNVILDGWTDVSKIHYVAVIVNFDTKSVQNQYEYIVNLDLTDRHNAPNQAHAVMDWLVLEKLVDSQVRPHYINSVCSACS